MISRVKLNILTTHAKSSTFLDKIIRYNPVCRRRAKKAICEFSKMSLEDRKRASRLMLEKTLRDAKDTEYGRNIDLAYEKWEILRKDLIHHNPNDFVTYAKFGVPAATGGTTGTPLRLWRSICSIAVEQAFLDNLLERYKLTFDNARIAVLRADTIKPISDNKPPYGILMYSGRRLVLSNAHLSYKTLDWYVRAIKEFRPDVLWAYPSMIGHLMYLMEKDDLSLRIPIILTSSEMLSPYEFENIEKFFSAKTIDYYGQGERVSFASATRKNEYWFEPAYGYVELQKVQNGACRSEADLALIISTGFWNRAMPLVRYNTEDTILVPRGSTQNDLEEIALGVRPFLGVLGRTNEFIVSSDGRQIGGLNHLPREVAHIHRLQLVQTNLRNVTIKIVATNQFCDYDRRLLIQNARELIPHDIDIHIEQTDKLNTTPNGKVPFVMCMF